MVRIQQLVLPNSFVQNGPGLVKSGGRTEYVLPLDDNVRSVADQLNVDMPLRFASIIVARQTDEPDQVFHEDGTYDSVNAIVYLTDVPAADYGAIEFQSDGPFLGERGSAVVYRATEIHRGLANRHVQDRVALGLVFSNDTRPIRTIGSTAGINVSGNGTVTVRNSGGDVIYTATPATGALTSIGDGIYTLDAVPDAGYSFLHWENGSGTVISTNPVYTYTVSGNTNVEYVTAVFGLPQAPSVTCFFANAPVLTPTGYRRIDSLKVGDLVTTADGTNSAIQRVKVQHVAASAETNPYIISKGRFGATKRLLISPNHNVLVEGRGLVKASALDLEQEDMTGELVYYNLELESWSNMIVAGVTVESLAPMRRITMSAAEFNKMANALPSASMAKLKQVCRFLADGRIEVPAISRKNVIARG